jgi:hypothetical protein
MGARLRREGEQEKSSSRPTDCDKPYEGRRFQNVVSATLANQKRSSDIHVNT